MNHGANLLDYDTASRKWEIQGHRCFDENSKYFYVFQKSKKME